VHRNSEYRRCKWEPKVSQHEVAKTWHPKCIGEFEAQGCTAPLLELDKQIFQPGKGPTKECRDECLQVRLVDQQASATDMITVLGQECELQPFFAFHC
jgi:hypothetical protein